MCDALFIGADRELALIQFEYGKSFMHLTNISETEETVLNKMNKPFVYYLGAYEGCACGFRYGVTEAEYGAEFVDLEKETNGRKSVEALFQYLFSELRPGEEFVLYSSWEGEFEIPLETETTINLASFELPASFEFSNHSKTRIIRE